ncbi:MAG TPA: hypothetical protein VHG69_02030 [Thermoleophilaceae bacterium]|nr:hypothetical protein [Thermoleophilaceae bacterium]
MPARGENETEDAGQVGGDVAGESDLFQATGPDPGPGNSDGGGFD